jgi:hypothetical protein
MDELSNTARIYKPVNDAEREHTAAIEAAKAAAARGDMAAMQAYFDKAEWLLEVQRAAAQRALKHSLAKRYKP